METPYKLFYNLFRISMISFYSNINKALFCLSLETIC